MLSLPKSPLQTCEHTWPPEIFLSLPFGNSESQMMIQGRELLLIELDSAVAMPISQIEKQR